MAFIVNKKFAQKQRRFIELCPEINPDIQSDCRDAAVAQMSSLCKAIDQCIMIAEKTPVLTEYAESLKKFSAHIAGSMAVARGAYMDSDDISEQDMEVLDKEYIRIIHNAKDSLENNLLPPDFVFVDSEDLK